MQRVITMCACNLPKTMANDQVTIYVQALDVKRWALFQEHYDPFVIMVDAGVFGIKNGNAVLHFDLFTSLPATHDHGMRIENNVQPDNNAVARKN